MKKFFSFSVFLLVNVLFSGQSFAQGANIWTRKSDLGFYLPNSPPPRSEGVGFSVGNKGFVGLGYDGTNYLNDFWEYDPVADLWTQKADFQGGTRGGAVAFSIGSFGYVGTGFNVNGQFKDFWQYDTAANTWQAKSDFQGGLRKFAVGFSINNKGYIGTG
jgi:N-acetylneuraminic acid mutarotase